MLHGIINVYKEKGYTSHDVVAKLRGIAGQKKIGHTGTLDPDAEGVLPICLGNGTKVCELLTDRDKTYKAVLLLGVSTDTQDISGKVLKKEETENLNADDVAEAIQSFVGEYDQIPPMYSALKVGGRKLYELAREGKCIERKARRVRIHEIRILHMELPRVEMEIKCSKGTYIRTLCHDVGEKLGVGGCMESLIRTEAGRFHIGDSIRLEILQEAKEQGKLEQYLIPVDVMFSEYQEIRVDQKLAKRLANGNEIPGRMINGIFRDQECVRVYDPDGRFAAIYKYVKDRREFQVVKMFPQ